MTRILIIGHGRMGRLVEQFAPAHGCEVAGVTTRGQSIDSRLSFDVAIDFSTADAVLDHVAAVAAMAGPKGPALQGVGPASRAIVIGTTGWQAQDAEVRAIAARRIGVLAAANFSLGLNAFLLIVEDAARRFAPHAEYGAWVHEAHHAMKRDAPSGTALLLKAAMADAGYGRAIDVSSTRAGNIPGTHTVGFDGTADTVTLTHTVRDRAVFAHGALEAARWLQGRRGWYSMKDMLGDAR